MRKNKEKTCDFKRVYVWEIPVRLFHWLNVLTILVLTITGFIIADPPALSSTAEASERFLFGYVRMIHFVTAFIFIANIIFRIYWAFKGNHFASIKHLIPYTKERWENVKHVFKVDVLLMKSKEHDLRTISVGHNAVAGLSYFFFSLMLLTQIFTGLALLAPTSDFWISDLFAWVTPLLGSESTVRFVHHLVTWLIIAFAIIHMYLVFYHDYIEARGESSAMVSGYKFVLKERIQPLDDSLEEEPVTEEEKVT